MELEKAWLIKIYDEYTNKVKSRHLFTNKHDIERTLSYFMECGDYYRVKKVKRKKD